MGYTTVKDNARFFLSKMSKQPSCQPNFLKALNRQVRPDSVSFSGPQRYRNFFRVESHWIKAL
jgi:hypothetical protein